MKTIFDVQAREELIERINSLDEDSTRQWGKMTVYQMLKHCTIWNEWIQGKSNLRYRQSFLGRIFGRMALKSVVGNDKPMDRNVPAGELKATETHGDVHAQKQKFIECISAYETFSNANFIHDFFGTMTKEEIGIFVYKHMDHHLRQFSR